MYIVKNDGFNIHRFKIEDSDSNFNYIVSCNETGECIVIDPIDPVLLLNYIRDNELKVKYVINTHAHPDHISGNNPIIKVFLSSKILIHAQGIDYVAPRSDTIDEGDEVIFGNQKLKVLHTPGHCPEHISLIIDNNIFVGDTIFVSGCGNTKFRGDVDELFKSFSKKLKNLEDDIKIFCGHDYAKINLEYALSIEPNNMSILNKIKDIKNQKEILTTIGEEKTYNPFMRYDNQELIQSLKSKYLDLNDDHRSVFTKLRELRNNW